MPTLVQRYVDTRSAGGDGTTPALTGPQEPAPALTVTAWIAATPQGAALAPGVSMTLTERSSLPGTYSGIFDGDALRTALGATLMGTIVWLVVKSGEDFEAVEPRRVSDRRPL